MSNQELVSRISELVVLLEYTKKEHKKAELNYQIQSLLKQIK